VAGIDEVTVVPLSGGCAPRNSNGLGALPRPLRVICWYWTKAIALPRVALHLHFVFLPEPRWLDGVTR
jgi:hypothetical protein